MTFLSSLLLGFLSHPVLVHSLGKRRLCGETKESPISIVLPSDFLLFSVEVKSRILSVLGELSTPVLPAADSVCGSGVSQGSSPEGSDSQLSSQSPRSPLGTRRIKMWFTLGENGSGPQATSAGLRSIQVTSGHKHIPCQSGRVRFFWKGLEMVPEVVSVITRTEGRKVKPSFLREVKHNFCPTAGFCLQRSVSEVQPRLCDFTDCLQAQAECSCSKVLLEA